MIKLFLYLICIPITIFAIDSININCIFKKNKVYQAKLFYLILVFSVSYLFTNFIYDFVYSIK